MTDKELMEKYLQGYREDICGYCSECHSECDSLNTQIDGYKDGFLAGLKASRPQWHDLRKNPDDLPKNREKVLLLVKLNDKWDRTETIVGYCDFGDCLGEHCKDWGYFEPVRNIYYDFVDGEEVLAWQYLPEPPVVNTIN